MMTKYVCIVCPNGCEITAERQGEKIAVLSGAGCRRGEEYVRSEMTNPVRSMASSVLLVGGVLPLASVRLSRPVPKSRIFDIMNEIKKTRLQAPVYIGQVAIKNVLGLNCDVIVTKNVAARKLGGRRTETNSSPKSRG